MFISTFSMGLYFITSLLRMIQTAIKKCLWVKLMFPIKEIFKSELVLPTPASKKSEHTISQ